MPSGQNKFQIFAIGDFGGIKCCRGEEINREKEHPEVTQPAWATQFKISHHRFFPVVQRLLLITRGHSQFRLDISPIVWSPRTATPPLPGVSRYAPTSGPVRAKCFAFFAVNQSDSESFLWLRLCRAVSVSLSLEGLLQEREIHQLSWRDILDTRFSQHRCDQ